MKSTQPQYIIRGDVPVTLMQGRSNARRINVNRDLSMLIAYGALAMLFFTLALLIYVKCH